MTVTSFLIYHIGLRLTFVSFEKIIASTVIYFLCFCDIIKRISFDIGEKQYVYYKRC